MAIMKKLLLTITFAILSNNVSAQDYDDGIEAWGNKNYALALTNLEPLARQGHLEAQKALGMIFFSNLNVLTDYTKAHKWFQLAANQGNNYAQYMIGTMYNIGLGVGSDSILAYMWLNIAFSNEFEASGETREALKAYMTTEDISKATAMARECMASDYKKCGY
tara:strand:+ start:160 stop:651 length:492 start_codon:yes stop_codon:yes gene_type:complete